MESGGTLSCSLTQKRALLRRIDRFYYGAKLGESHEPGPQGCCSGLEAIGKGLSVDIDPPHSEALLLVVGDAGSGKSSFVNALAQELVLPTSDVQSSSSSSALIRERKRRALVEWVRSRDVAPGSWPRLLTKAAGQFPGWSSASHVAKGCRFVNGIWMDGIELAEVAAFDDLNEEDKEAIAWLAAKADVVVVLLDSQQTMPSESLLKWLTALAGPPQCPALQFVFSKADLVTRESDRIRVIAKVSRTLNERLGRGFEILPVATGDVGAILDSIEAAGGAGDKASLDEGTGRKYDAGRLRALRAVQDSAGQHLEHGLQALRRDCATLSAAISAHSQSCHPAVAKARPRKALASQFGWAGIAFLIVTALVPVILTEEDEAAVRHGMSIGAAMIALFCLAIAVLIGSGAVDAAILAAEENGDQLVIREQERFLRLVARQAATWESGEAPGGASDQSDSSADGAGARRRLAQPDGDR
ncbi:unnamed protein product [Polarella glacialis]|uniref:G domain-containing protein n=1 Tax=Polarella glacialis TaxID=89957 RepID=A0A813IFP9_POLGL|nr:unnamed protein product [Polarella glacialis]